MNAVTPDELAEQILEDSGYIDMLKMDKSVEAPGRLENLKELVNVMSDTEKYPTLADFMEHVSLVMDKDDMTNDNKVMLITLHSAKGLEFDVVFLPGWEEGLFPHQRSMDEGGSEALEEERRLAYVAITRARQNFTFPWRITAEFTDSGKTIFRHGSSTNFRRQTLKSAINALTSIAGIMVAVRITKTPTATAIITVSLAVGTTIRKAR